MTITKFKLGTSNNKGEDVVYRLRKRAEIRRSILDRKSVQENKPDRIADLLGEAAEEIENLRNFIGEQGEIIVRLQRLLEKEDDWK